MSRTRREQLGRRSRTVAPKRLTAAIRMRGWLDLGLTPAEAEEMHGTRPRTRAECAGVQRPCPYVSCRHSLYLDVNPETGAIKLNFPTREPWEMPADASCALDVAERGGMTLEDVGTLTNLTRERVRQVETHGAHVMRCTLAEDGLDASDVVFPRPEHMSDDDGTGRQASNRRASRKYREKRANGGAR